MFNQFENQQETVWFIDGCNNDNCLGYCDVLYYAHDKYWMGCRVPSKICECMVNRFCCSFPNKPLNVSSSKTVN